MNDRGQAGVTEHKNKVEKHVLALKMGFTHYDTHSRSSEAGS